MDALVVMGIVVAACVAYCVWCVCAGGKEGDDDPR